MLSVAAHTAETPLAAYCFDPPVKQTLRPIVTGSSVLGVVYKDGVLMAADTMASYGSMLRYKDVSRISAVGRFTLLGASGEYSDFQNITNMLRELETRDWTAQDGSALSSHEYASYLSRVMYNRRCKLNPYWNSCVIAGHKDNKPFLGNVDMYGKCFSETYIATGFGSYIATPILRAEARPDMTEEEARELLLKCLRILLLRHCQGHNKIIFAKATAEGTSIEAPIVIQGNWNINDFMQYTTVSDIAACSW